MTRRAREANTLHITSLRRRTSGTQGYRGLRKQVLLAFETEYVTWLLRRAEGNISEAARMAKIDRKHLWRILQRIGHPARRPRRTKAASRARR